MKYNDKNYNKTSESHNVALSLIEFKTIKKTSRKLIELKNNTNRKLVFIVYSTHSNFNCYPKFGNLIPQENYRLDLIYNYNEMTEDILLNEIQ